MNAKENLFASAFSALVLLILALASNVLLSPPKQEDLIWLIGIVLVISMSSRWFARKIFQRFFNTTKENK